MKTKKILKVLLLLSVLCCVLTFTGCLEDASAQLNCEHEYVETDSTATCTSMGNITYKCDKCGRTMTVRVESAGHKYAQVDKKDPTCQEEGFLKEKCSVCGDEKTTTLEKVDHHYGEWIVTKEMTSKEDGEETRTCDMCHGTQTRLISRVPELDLSVIKYDFKAQSTYTADTFEDLCVLFNAGLLNMVDAMDIDLKFHVDSFDTLFNNMLDAKAVPFDYQVKSSFQSIAGYGTMKLEFTYLNIPKTSTPKAVKYVQYKSANLGTVTQTRANDFDNFKINKSSYSYEVSSSEQLVYVLERRVKPVPVANSSAERLYNKMKEILRQIITDDMDDYQKVKAIHDWIVMNVIYDQELLSMIGNTGDEIKQYDGFYLEGVFDKGYAVCEGISKAVCALANIEGIPCVRVSGHETGDKNSVGHAWNKIYIDGNWYILDATSDGTIVGGQYEVLSYAYFLISDEEMKKRYTGEDYEDYLCSTNYNILANSTFNLASKDHTYNAKSRSDLEYIIAYFNSFKEDDITIQFKLDYEYSGSYSDELSAVYTKLLIFSGYSVVTTDDYIMLVK